MGSEPRTIPYEVFSESLGSYLCHFVAKDGSREIVSTVITACLGMAETANGFLWYMYGQL